MTQELISLRIFSGVHLGAEINLSEGSYIVGKDDSCDIILYDQGLLARHVQLKIISTKRIPASSMDTLEMHSIDKNGIAENSIAEASLDNSNSVEEIDINDVQVQIINLDGVVTLYGETLTDDIILEPRTPYYIGQTCFAWTEYGAFDYAWNTVSSNMQKNNTQLADMNNINESDNIFLNNTDLSKVVISPLDNNVGSNSDNNVGDDDGENETENVEERKNYIGRKKNWKGFARYFFAILLVLTLTITIQDTFETLPNNLELLTKELEKTGFSHLTIREEKRGLTLTGLLKDDKERGQLVTLAQKMHFPVYLDIKIHDDLVNSLTLAYNGQGFYPDISLDIDKNQVVVRGYLKDKLMLYVIDDYVQKNIPALSNQTIVYIIYYADELQEIIVPRINEAELDFMDIQYLTGTLSVIGNLNSEQKSKLNDIFNTISLSLEIPLIVELTLAVANELRSLEINESGFVARESNIDERLTEKNVADTVRSKGGESNNNFSTTMDFNVSSVTLEPVKFIVLSTGERIFEGGLLSGDFILKTIRLNELILDKNGITSTYHLKK